MSIKEHGIHPGAKGIYAIVEYTVAEYGLYSITDSLVGQNGEWKDAESSDGIEVEVFVLPEQGNGVKQTTMVKVMDNHVGFQTKNEAWSHKLADVAFDGSLGILAQGARIFVCV